MSLQRKPTWKSNWNQDKHMIIESQGNGKEILNHYLILLRQGCLRHFSSLKLSWEAGDHHSVLVVNVPFLFRSQDCPVFCSFPKLRSTAKAMVRRVLAGLP